MFFKKIMIIVNPRAGMGRGEKLLKEIEKWRDKITRKLEIEVVVELTERFGERNAMNLAKKAVQEKYDLVIVVGGDGTINEVVNGLVDSSIPIGIVSAGSGNDFTKSFRIPNDVEMALNGAFFGKVETVDLGKMNDRIFVNAASVGFDARVAKYSENLRNKWHFFPAVFIYLIALLRELFFKIRYPYIEINLFRDEKQFEKIRERITLVAVANGHTYGGKFRIAPHADLKDGFLDVCLIKKISRIRIFKFIPRVFKGTHLEIPEVKKDIDGKLPKVFSLTISSLENKNLPCQVDGEIPPFQKEYKITVLPKALKIMVPKIPRFKPRDLLF